MTDSANEKAADALRDRMTLLAQESKENEQDFASVQSEAFKLLDSSLQTLLLSLKLEQTISAPLVFHKIMHIDKLADQLRQSPPASLFTHPTTVPFPQSCRQELERATETRYALGKTGILSAPDQSWVDELCSSYGSFGALSKLSFAQLTAHLNEAASISEKERRAVEEVWAFSESSSDPSRSIRRHVIQAGLPLRILDFFEVDHQLSTLEDFSEQMYESACQFLLTKEDEKVNLLRLFKTFSSVAISRAAEEKSQEDERTATLSDALANIAMLKAQVEAVPPLSQDSLQKQLQDVNSSLFASAFTPVHNCGPKWCVTSKEAASPDLTLSKLGEFEKQLIGVLQNAQAPEVLKHDDSKIISEISRGQALRGIPFGMSPDLVDKQAPYELLRLPAYSRFTTPTMPIEWTAQEFSSAIMCDRFNESLLHCGKSVSAALKASGWSFSLLENASGATSSTASFHTMMPKQLQISTSAAKSLYLFVPLRSFSLNLEDMQLSKAAQDEAKGIRNLQEARLFLEHFFSHVPSGRQHVGGVFILSVQVTTDTNSSVASLSKKVSSIFQETCNRGLSLKDSSWTESFEDSISSKIEEKSCRANCSLKCSGPSVSNPDLFVIALNRIKSNWCIIDRGGLESLEPVWKIVERDPLPEVRSKAPLLREAWLIMARSWTSLGDAKITTHIRNVELEHRAHILGFQVSLPIVRQPTDSELNHIHQINDAIVQIDSAIAVRVGQTLNIAQMTRVGLAQVVLDIWQSISKFNVYYSRDLLPDVLARGSLMQFIREIAYCEMRMSSVVECARDLLRVLIPPLEHESFLSSADPRVLAMFKERDDPSKGQRVPQLVDRLVNLPNLVDKFINYSETAHLSVQERSRQLGVLLSANLFRNNLRNDREVMLHCVLQQALAQEFDFMQGGFHQPLDETQLNLVARRITEVIDHFKRLPQNATESDLASLVFGKTEKDSHNLDPEVEYDAKVVDSGFTYNSLLVDRVFDISGPASAGQKFIDTCRHGLFLKELSEEFQKHLSPANETGPFFDFEMIDLDTEDLDQTLTVSNQEANHVALYGVALSVLTKCDVPAQEALLTLIFNQRFAAPLLMSSGLTAGGCISFLTTPALSFIQVPTSSSQAACLSTDTKLFRLAVLSQRPSSEVSTGALLRNLFFCQSMQEWDKNSLSSFPESSCLVEVGIGFLPRASKDGSVKPDSGDRKDQKNTTEAMTPILIVHIIGDYRGLLPQLIKQELVHAFFVEDMPTGASGGDFISTFDTSDFNHYQLFLFKPSPRDQPIQVKNLSSCKKRYLHIEGFVQGQDSGLTLNIRASLNPLYDALYKAKRSSPLPSLDVAFSVFAMDDATKKARATVLAIDKEVNDVVSGCDFKDLRPSKLLMQFSFVREAEAELKAAEDSAKSGLSAAVQTATIRKCDEEVRFRKEHLFKDVVGILRLMLKAAREPDVGRRFLYFRCLEKAIEVASRPVLEQLKEYSTRVAKESEDYPNDSYRQHRALQAKSQFANTFCNLEHLWRELSHMYIAARKQSYCQFLDVAGCAAIHMMDGFPLELLDGDAGKLNEDWIMSVLDKLHEALKKKHGCSVRVFVLSILGVQSAGKSTLLNILFGSRFRVSVGMTTRGLNLMLIRAQDRTEYDYILLLDTEGVRSEALKASASRARDNRIAAFALWLADATIMLIAHENTDAVKDILPVIAFAYKASPLADKYGTQLGARVFFVQRSIQSNASDAVGAADTLKSNLRSQLLIALRNIESDAPDIKKQTPVLQDPMALDQLSPSAMQYQYQRELDILGAKIMANAQDCKFSEDSMLGALISTFENGSPHCDAAFAKLRAADSSQMAKLLELAAAHKSFFPSNPTLSVASKSSSSVIGFLKDFDIDRDHILVGNHTIQQMPPISMTVPNPEYGKRILGLREQIHRSVTSNNWSARTLKQWSEIVKETWIAIKSVNLALSSSSVEQGVALQRMDQQAEQKRHEVATAYATALENLNATFNKEKEAMLARTKQDLEGDAFVSHRTVSENDILEQFKLNLQQIISDAVKDAVDAAKDNMESMKRDPRFEMYEDFVESTTRRFTDFLEDQKKLSKRRLEDLVANRHLYKSIVEQYKKQIQQEVVQRLRKEDANIARNWTQAQREKVFRAIFSPILQDAREKYPPISSEVHGRIHSVYKSLRQLYEVMPMTIGTPSKCMNVDDADSKGILKLLMPFKKFWSWMTHADERQRLHDEHDEKQRLRDEHCLELLISKVEAKLQSVTQYSDPIIHEIINLSLEHLGTDRRLEFRKEAHQRVYSLLVFRLMKKQELWEETNSVPQRLVRERADLFTVFQAKCDGVTQLQLLRKRIENLIAPGSEILLKAYTQICELAVIKDLERKDEAGVLKHPWAGSTSSEALQALVDLDLAATFLSGDNKKLLQQLDKTGEHYKEVMMRQLRSVTDSVISTTDLWDNLRNKIAEHLLAASKSAHSCPAGRTRAFLLSISQAMDLPSALTDAIPPPDDFGNSLDDEADGFLTIGNELVAALAPSGLGGRPFVSDATSQIPGKFGGVAEAVFAEMSIYRDNRSVKARCTVCCGHCGLSCILESFHVGDHTSHHQPGGLIGGGDSFDRSIARLNPRSCLEVYQQKRRIQHQGKEYTFDQWSTAFPGWEVPSSRRTAIRLKLREYIFYHKQKLLSTHFGRKPYDPADMVHFNHDLDELMQQLSKVAGVPPPPTKEAEEEKEEEEEEEEEKEEEEEDVS